MTSVGKLVLSSLYRCLFINIYKSRKFILFDGWMKKENLSQWAVKIEWIKFNQPNSNKETFYAIYVIANYVFSFLWFWIFSTGQILWWKNETQSFFFFDYYLNTDDGKFSIRVVKSKNNLKHFFWCYFFFFCYKIQNYIIFFVFTCPPFFY